MDIYSNKKIRERKNWKSIYLSIYLSLIKTENVIFEVFIGIVRQKKGHHQILRQKMKNTHAAFSKKVVILAPKKGKEFFGKKGLDSNPFFGPKTGLLCFLLAEQSGSSDKGQAMNGNLAPIHSLQTEI